MFYNINDNFIKNIKRDDNHQNIDDKNKEFLKTENLFNKKLISKIAKISGFAINIFSDILVAITAAPLFLFAACYKSNFDPSPHQVKKHAPPILLIHGNSSNESQWILFSQKLSKEQYGSVFTLNLDGILSNQPKNGIFEYATKVAEKVKQIKAMTNRDDIILVGHSMGGLVASYYAEHCWEETGVKAIKVITISTPWKKPWILEFLGSLFPKLFKEPERLKNMSNHHHFLDHLRAEAMKSQKNGERKYYYITCETDPIIGNTGQLEELPETQKKDFKWMAHLTPMIDPRVINQVEEWIVS